MLPSFNSSALSASHTFHTTLYPPNIQVCLPTRTILGPQRNEQACICKAASTSAPPGANKTPRKQDAPNSLPYFARRARRQRRLQQGKQGEEANPHAANIACGQHQSQEDTPSSTLLHSQQDQTSAAELMMPSRQDSQDKSHQSKYKTASLPGQAPGAPKNCRTHRRAAVEALSCKLTSDISHAHSLHELSRLLDKHGASMNIVNITAFLTRLPRLLREKYMPAAQQATHPGGGDGGGAVTAAADTDGPGTPSILLLPPEEAAAFERPPSRVSPLTQAIMHNQGRSAYTHSTHESHSLRTQDHRVANGSKFGQQPAQEPQDPCRSRSGVGSAANEGKGIIGASVGYASRQEPEGMEREVGEDRNAWHGSADTITDSGMREWPAPLGYSTRTRSTGNISSSGNSSSSGKSSGDGNTSSSESSESSTTRAAAAQKKWHRTLKHAQELARHVLLLLQPLILEVDGRGIANVLHALACLELHDTDIIDDLLYLSIDFLPTLNGQALSNIIYALACLGVRPQRQWSIAFFRHSLPVLPTFSLQSLSNTMWALARLRLSPRAGGFNKDWDGAMFAAAQARLSGPPSLDGQVTPQALSNLTWAIGALDLHPPLGLRTALLAHSQRSMGAFSPQGMANMLWGLARTQTSVPSAWMAIFAEVTRPKLSSYNTLVLGTLLYSLALLRQPLPDRMPDPSTPITTHGAANARANLVWDGEDRWDMVGMGGPGGQISPFLSSAAIAAAPPSIAHTLPPQFLSPPSQSPSQQHQAAPCPESSTPNTANASTSATAAPITSTVPTPTHMTFTATTPNTTFTSATATPNTSATTPTATSTSATATPIFSATTPNTTSTFATTTPINSATIPTATSTSATATAPSTNAASSTASRCSQSHPQQYQANPDPKCSTNTKAISTTTTTATATPNTARATATPTASRCAQSQSHPQQHQATPTPKCSTNTIANSTTTTSAAATPNTATATASPNTTTTTATSTASRCAHAFGAWFSEAQRVLLLSLPHCSPRTTSNLWYSFGRLRRVPEPPLLQALLAHSQQQLPDMQPQGLANTTWALACLGIVPSPCWVAVLLEAAGPKLGDMNAQELSNFVWGLSKLGHRPDGAWLQQMVHQSSLKLPDYNPLNLASTACALATFRFCPGLAWQQAFARRLHEILHSLRHIHKIRILQAVAQLALPLPRPLLAQLGASATADVTQVSMNEASVVLLLAMVALRLPISPQWLEMFAGETEAHAGETQPSQLADIAGAFAALSYQPMPSLLAAMDAQMLGQQQPLPQPHVMDINQHHQQQQQQQQQRHQHSWNQVLEQQDLHHLGIWDKQLHQWQQQQQQQWQQQQQQIQTQAQPHHQHQQPEEQHQRQPPLLQNQQQQQQQQQQQLQHHTDKHPQPLPPWVPSHQKSGLQQPPKKPAPPLHMLVHPHAEGHPQLPKKSAPIALDLARPHAEGHLQQPLAVSVPLEQLQHQHQTGGHLQQPPAVSAPLEQLQHQHQAGGNLGQPKKPIPLVHTFARPFREGHQQQPLPSFLPLEQEHQQQQHQHQRQHQRQKGSLPEQQHMQPLAPKLAFPQQQSQPGALDSKETMAQQAALRALCRYVSLRPSFSTPPSPAWLHGAQQQLCSPAAMRALPAETFLLALGALARMGQPPHAALAHVAARYAGLSPVNVSSQCQEAELQRQQQQQQQRQGTVVPSLQHHQ